MEKLAIERNYIMNIYIETIDNEQIHKATIASNQIKKRKHIKKWLVSSSRLSPEEGVSYSAGASEITEYNRINFFSLLLICVGVLDLQTFAYNSRPSNTLKS